MSNFETQTLTNRRFTTALGNKAVVKQSYAVGNNEFFTGMGECVRTFVEVAGKVVECDAGCSFQAESRCAEAGV